MSLTLRDARVDDVDRILAFIRELAAYEKLEAWVTATEDDLRRTLFGTPRAAEVRLAEWNGEPAGFALFFHNYSTFLGKPGVYLEDLFVREPFRGRGIGRALLADLAGIARRRGCGRLEWWVLDWNADAIEFYEGLGARGMREWIPFRVDGEALDRLADSAAD